MKTLNSHAGYFVIDHRDSPGLTAADVAHVPGAIPVPGGDLLERDVKQCTHCQRAVVLNPGRVRARAVCQKCFHYICDECDAARAAAGGACVPFKAVLDLALELDVKFAGDPNHPAAGDPLVLASQPAPFVTVPDGPRIVLTDT
jgi:hypothetical protein